MPSVLVTGAGKAVTALNPQRISPVILDATDAGHIDVAIIEPAQTDTDMWRTADDMVEQAEARYVVGVGPKLQVVLMTNLPARVRDLLLRRVTSQP